MPLHKHDSELLEEIVQAIRSITFGSIVLTIHDGQVVEVTKTERVRKNSVQRSSHK